MVEPVVVVVLVQMAALGTQVQQVWVA